MKTSIFMLAMVISLTSIGAYLVGVKWLGLAAQLLKRALDKMLECIGAIVLFVVLNVVLGTTIILTIRILTGKFISVYVMNDVAWLGFSLLQGVTFQWWRELNRKKCDQP